MRWTLVGCVAIVFLAAFGSVAAPRLGFDRGDLLPLELLIFAVSGFLAGRSSNRASAGALAGGAVALTDASVGWPMPGLLEPGAASSIQWRAQAVRVELLAVTVASVVVLGAALGLVGAWLAQRLRPAL